MAEILLVTLNSTYQHSSFGLRYLFANLQEFQDKTKILELTIALKPEAVVEKILENKPKLVGFGVYIWNTNQTNKVIQLLKAQAPEICIVLGGPEVTHESEAQEICLHADYIIKGEADFLFYEFCQKYFSGVAQQKFISGPLPEINKIKYPYAFYSDEDIKNRVIYVEASRGCPYKCEYCLSSLDKSVRNFEINSFLKEMDLLINRRTRVFKFVDRTFNLSPTISISILKFFLEHIDKNLFLHFEMVPDRLPDELKDLISQFPHGSLQFEVGIQTWNTEVAKNVSRRQDYPKIQENFEFLKTKTGVHSHADLIVGLPGEDLNSFALGFDAVALCGPDEIQVGILKRLKGAPISRHSQAFAMIYDHNPPFQVISTMHMPAETIAKMVRFAKFWDLFANSGNFKNTMTAIKKSSYERPDISLFWGFYEFTDFLDHRHPQTFGIPLLALVEDAWIYLREYLHLSDEEAKKILIADYGLDGKRNLPHYLKTKDYVYNPAQNKQAGLTQRQNRHKN